MSRAEGGQQPAVRALIAAVLRDEDCQAFLGELCSDAIVETAADERVLSLLEWHLRRSPVWPTLPAGMRMRLADAAREDAMTALFREKELRRVAAAFAATGLHALLLKGSALAHWLYPELYLRECSDIDLLLPDREAVLRAARACEPLGYSLAYVPAASHFEMPCQLRAGDRIQCELDLHFRLANSPVFGERFGFAELWQAAVPVPGVDAALRRLAPVHAFFNACLNRALDRQNGLPDRLRLLYDLHLLLVRMDAAEAQALRELAVARGLAGTCLCSVDETIATFATIPPPSLHDALAKGAPAEALDARRLGDWRYMQWQTLKALPGTGARLRWLRERLLPTASHLRGLHGEGPWLRLVGRRLWRGVERLLGRR